MYLLLFKIYQLIKFKKKGYPINPNKVLRQLMRSQYWSKEKLKEYQLDKLNQLLFLTKNSTDYYADKLDNVQLPLQNFEELYNKVPLIDKRLIIKNYEKLKTEEFSNKFLQSTSGTTGDPLIIYKSGMSMVYGLAGHLRFHSWWGINANDKNVYIARKKTLSNESFLTKLKIYLRRRLDIDVFDLNDKTIVKYYNQIEQFKPSYIRGYKSGVLELAQLMNNNDLKFQNFKLKVVIVTSEVLYDNERKFIEEILDCKVANEYGSVEAGGYANECPSGSMHINEEAVLVNTNDKNEAIVTEFENRSMPLINYKNDDVIIISDKMCECGRTSRIIDRVDGRVSGYIIREDGTKVNQVIIPVIFLELYNSEIKNSVKKFQIIQRKNIFVVKIVPLLSFNKESEEFIRKRLVEEIGPEINIEFEIVDEILRDKSGKFRIFKNEG